MSKVDRKRGLFLRARSMALPIVVITVVFGGVAVAAYRSMGQEPAPMAFSEIIPVKATTGASLLIDREEAELGEMNVEQVASATFQLKNNGTQPVEFSQVRTSCMCTFAEIALPAGRSPEFNMAMHNDAAANTWKGILKPGEEALVTVTYRPSLMPVEGSVARNVKFATTDPQNPVVELGVHATVKGGAT